MAAYNGAGFLPAAIDSILNQTYGDFEFIIIDDGSSDATPEVIRGYTDPRIRPVHNPQNLGLIGSLNRGLDLARGEFVARMDADDEALPRRFEEQVRFFDAHPEIGLCGTAIETFGARTERWALECEPARVRCQMLFDSGLSHPTAMFRRSILEANNLRYDPAYLHAEDYALWVRLAETTEVANLPLVLLKYRLHPGSVSHTSRAVQQDTADRIRREQLHRLGVDPSAGQMVIHTTLMRGAPHTLKIGVDEAEAWLAALLEANRRSGYCDQAALGSMLYDMWFKLCRSHRGSLRSAGWRFLRSPVARGAARLNRLADTARLFMLSRKSA
jgi:glycosyltransferase involved in cell wall biosynthesis